LIATSIIAFQLDHHVRGDNYEKKKEFAEKQRLEELENKKKEIEEKKKELERVRTQIKGDKETRKDINWVARAQAPEKKAPSSSETENKFE